MTNKKDVIPLTNEQKEKLRKAFERAYEIAYGHKVKLSWADKDQQDEPLER